MVTVGYGRAMAQCDWCKQEKPRTSTQTIGPSKSFIMCDECAEDAKKDGTPA
jgi:hypothetical protein